jgi:hypothetical protein
VSRIETPQPPEAIKGTERPAIGKPPFEVMADLIEDVQWLAHPPAAEAALQKARPLIEAAFRLADANVGDIIESIRALRAAVKAYREG